MRWPGIGFRCAPHTGHTTLPNVPRAPGRNEPRHFFSIRPLVAVVAISAPPTSSRVPGSDFQDLPAERGHRFLQCRSEAREITFGHMT
jgi:hypothetical protein